MRSKIKQVILDNGLRVFLEHLPHQEKCLIRIGINVGSRDEPANILGISHLVEHMHLKSNRFRSMKRFVIDLEKRGAEIEAGTDESTTEFWIRCLPRYLLDVVEIFFEAISNFDYDNEELRREKDGVLTEINNYLDEPSAYQFDQIFIPAVFNGTPLGKPMYGTPGLIKKINKEDIIGFKRHFYQPGNMMVVVSGRFNEEKLLNALKNSFENLNGAFFNTHQPLLKIDKQKFWVIKRKKGINQAYLTVGLPILNFNKMNDEEFSALSLWCALLCGGFSTRLSYRLCGEQVDIYDISAELENWGGIGLIHIRVRGCNPLRFSKILDAIFEEIKSINVETIKKEEMETAKAIFLSNYLDNLQDLEFRTEEILKKGFGYASYDFRNVAKLIRRMNSRKFHNIIKKYIPRARSKWTISALVPSGFRLKL